MSTILSSKINRLLSYNPSGIVLLSSWLNEQGYSLDLQKRYRKSGWLKSIGHGAMIRTGDKVAYEGALYALQTQREMSTHIAGKSALSLLGKSHYLEVAQKKVILFGDLDESLPKWFVNHSWGVDIDYYQSSFNVFDTTTPFISFIAKTKWPFKKVSTNSIRLFFSVFTATAALN